MSNVTPINVNAPDTRPIQDLTEVEVKARAKSSMLALKSAMDSNDVAGALAALKSYSPEIDIVSYLQVKMILQQGMEDCGRVCFCTKLGWYDRADHPDAE